jgi:oxygen-independent coproporphyrinogen-3 oxidase
MIDVAPTSPHSAAAASAQTRGSDAPSSGGLAPDAPSRSASGPGSAEPGFGLYVHWPFCLSKCPYCDFNSHVRHQPPDEDRFLAAFRAEIGNRAAATGKRRLDSIFFGGGTPSLMAPRTVDGVLQAAAKAWEFSPDIEITLEANPTSVEAERFRGYRTAGVNRVSLGVQAMNDADLKALGRLHSVEEAMAAVDVARANFERFSFDLIYARPGQTPAQWASELREGLQRAGGHMSLYQLTIEPDTTFEKLFRAGLLQTPDAEVARALWETTQEIMEGAGMPAYEISNHARPGQESRHNLVYWRYGDYVGVGPGAHGRVTQGRLRRAQACERSPEAWLKRVESEGHGLTVDEALSAEEQGDEFLLMGLRLTEGLDPERFETLAGRPLDRGRVASLVESGLVAVTPAGRLRVTEEGFPVLDAVVADLAA